MWNLFLILPLLAPLALAQDGVQVSCENEAGEPIPCWTQSFATESKSNEEEWDCDVRSWTRAPDLIPGNTIPAETRLALNGTQCGDIIGWQIGLRMKERALIKIRNYDIDFPEKPKRKPWNETRALMQANRHDWNDIYTGRGGSWSMNRDDEEYETQLDAYNEAIRNKSLFEVGGQERVIFDDKFPLHLNEIKNDVSTNHIQAFSVDVPFTNFPPMSAHGGRGGQSGKDEQMLSTEAMFEYYHLLHLRNGTTLDYPAGQAGFLTEPFPISSAQQTGQRREMTWPAKIAFESPRINNDSKAEETEDGFIDFMRERNMGPECDAGNRAAFTMKITSNVKQVTPDQNVTLSIHLQRTGNGTEYPAYIDLSFSTSENVTFAYEHEAISSIERYRGLIQENAQHDYRGSDYPEKMLLIQSPGSLERRRKESGSSGFMSWSSDDGRLPAMPGTVRYDFEEIYEKVGDREEYDFEIELPIPYNIFPNFEKTFVTYTPQISFNLMTTFLCAAKVEEEIEMDEDTKLDGRWEEWSLPTKRRSKGGHFNDQRLRHTASLPLQIHRESNISPSDQERMKHYLDADAMAPSLSPDTVSQITPLRNEAVFTLVNTENRKEDETEFKQSKYRGRQPEPRCARGPNPGRACWSRNNGGSGSHAAKLWQRFEEEAKNGISKEQLKEEQIVWTMAG